MKNIKKVIYVVLGTLCVALGTIGIVLPILPTTPFLLLAAYFYIRSSKRLYDWLIHHKVFGAYIYHYVTYKAVPKRAKISAILLIWITVPISTYLIGNKIVYFILPSIALIVTIYILSLKTLRLSDEEKQAYRLKQQKTSTD